MLQQKAIILWNRQVSATYHRMGLGGLHGYHNAVPGQFVMARIGPGQEPLLRRPFSIFGLSDDSKQSAGIELLYKVVGQGTDLLSKMAQNQTVDLLGPLGRGFQLQTGHGPFYLAAGGIGVAPIRFLALDLKKNGIDPANCRIFLGGRTQEDLLCQEEFNRLGMLVTITTDDGSAGDHCFLTDPLAEAILEQKPAMVYACGPHGMLQCVADIVTRQQVPCQVSIETMMACGMGACLGCAVETSDASNGYLHACKDGPVFDSRRLKWNG